MISQVAGTARGTTCDTELSGVSSFSLTQSTQRLTLQSVPEEQFSKNCQSDNKFLAEGVGIEPTSRHVRCRDNGFEVRKDHQILSASTL